MIIKKIEIENFRSYYKSNVFELVNSLNSNFRNTII